MTVFQSKKKGWLPPSLESRISTIETWVKRLMRLCPISAMSQELVKFDDLCEKGPFWSFQTFTLGGDVELTSLDMHFPVADVYDGISFPEGNSDQPE